MTWSWSLLDLPPTTTAVSGSGAGGATVATGVLVSYDETVRRAVVRLFDRDLPIPAAPGIYAAGAAVQVTLDATGRPVLVAPPASLDVVDTAVPGAVAGDGADRPDPIVVGPEPDIAGTGLAHRLTEAAERVAHLDDATQALGADLAGLDERLSGDLARAEARITTAERAPGPEDAAGRPAGALWYQYAPGGTLVAAWRLVEGHWQAADLDPAFVPAIDIGTGTFGDLDGRRLTAATVTADALAANLALVRDLIAGDPAGARAVIGPGGIVFYGSDGRSVEFALGVDGTAVFSGQVVGADVVGSTIRTAVSGQRMQTDQTSVMFYSGLDALDAGPARIVARPDGLEGGLEVASPRARTPAGDRQATLWLAVDRDTGHRAARFLDTNVQAPNLTAGRTLAPLVLVERTGTPQAIAPVVFTPVSWTTRAEDTTMAPTAAPTRLVAPVAGLYRVEAMVIFENRGAGASESRTVRFAVTTAATGVVRYMRGHSGPANPAANYTEYGASAYVRLAAGDYVQVEAWSTIALNVIADQGTRAALAWTRP